MPSASQAVVVGNGRGYLTTLITGNVNNEKIQAALDSANSGLPHYKQLRAFYRIDEPFTIENGLLTANGKLKREVSPTVFATKSIPCTRLRGSGLNQSGSQDGMNEFKGRTLSWQIMNGAVELAMHRDPCNEIGSLTLDELEKFASVIPKLARESHALIVYSTQKAGFSAGADLRELFHRGQQMEKASALRGVREFLERIHAVMNVLDAAPITTIAAVHGVTFGGGFELALVCDIMIADRMARFCFPELRLGLIPGFGGIPRLKRDWAMRWCETFCLPAAVSTS